MREGTLRFQPTAGEPAVARLRRRDAEVNWLTAEQSNSSLTIGDKVMLKIFRRISAGEHPEAEMSRYLDGREFHQCAAASWRHGADRPRWHAAHAGGRVGFCPQSGRRLGMDTRSTDARARQSSPHDSEFDMLSDCEAIAATIGRRLGEMHAVLARQTSEKPLLPKSPMPKTSALGLTKQSSASKRHLRLIEQNARLGYRSRIVSAPRNCSVSGRGWRLQSKDLAQGRRSGP